MFRLALAENQDALILPVIPEDIALSICLKNTDRKMLIGHPRMSEVIIINGI